MPMSKPIYFCIHSFSYVVSYQRIYIAPLPVRLLAIQKYSQLDIPEEIRESSSREETREEIYYGVLRGITPHRKTAMAIAKCLAMASCFPATWILRNAYIIHV